VTVKLGFDAQQLQADAASEAKAFGLGEAKGKAKVGNKKSTRKNLEESFLKWSAEFLRDMASSLGVPSSRLLMDGCTVRKVQLVCWCLRYVII